MPVGETQKTGGFQFGDNLFYGSGNTKSPDPIYSAPSIGLPPKAAPYNNYANDREAGVTPPPFIIGQTGAAGKKGADALPVMLPETSGQSSGEEVSSPIVSPILFGVILGGFLLAVKLMRK